MSEIDRQRLKKIFVEAIETPTEQRAAFLDTACADEPALRTRIERLLEMHDRTESFLVEPTAGFGLSRFARPGESIGDEIGHYKLLQLIGEGGFGTVYLAEQSEPVRRLVALKIIKLGMDTRQVIARFEAEKQALAMMDHPNIARVFDAGATGTGRPYFVMEWVQGTPITQFCDQHNLTPPQRLELFVTVCLAVQHAHQKGIIHRDIKPSNVLVAMQDPGGPVVKVIDFGIAKATEARLTEKTVFTQERQLIGTPQYMSPEQADSSANDIDTRSDIYSLGALLYEMLTGSPPFDSQRLRSAAFGEIQRIIREEDPPKPSTRLSAMGAALNRVAQQRQLAPSKLTKLLRGDLDWIVMRAMEKDRARRYDTASALAEDVRRHLGDQPVVAGPPGSGYRLRKFARRHRTGAFASALVTLALVAGAAVAAIGFLRASRERALAEAARIDADSRRVIAERQTRIAEEVNSFLTDDLLAAVDPGNRGRDVTVLEVLKAASDNIEGKFHEAPAVEAAVQSTIGNTYWKLGELKEAESHLQRALELHRNKFGDDHSETLTSWTRLAGIYRAQGRLAEAEPIYSSVVQKRKKVLGEQNPLSITSMSNLAGLYREQGRYADALPLYVHALDLCRHLSADSPQRLTVMEGLGGMYKDLGRYADAEPLYVEVLELNRRLRGAEHPLTLATMNNLAVVYRRVGRFDRAEPLCVEAYEVQKKRLTERHPSTLISMTNLAKLYLEMGQTDKALPLYERAFQLSREVLGDEHRGTLITMTGLSELYARTGRYEQAEKISLDALHISERTSGEDAPQTLMLRHDLASLYLKWNRPDDAAPLAASSVEGARRAFPKDHWYVGAFLNTYGRALSLQANYDQAEEVLLEAHQILSAALGDASQDTIDSVQSLIALNDRWNKPEEAAVWRSRLPATTQSTR